MASIRNNNTNKKYHQKSSKKRWVVAGVAILLLLAAAGGAYALYRHNSTANTATPVDAAPSRKIDYSPAKPEDTKPTEQRKDNPQKSSDTLSNGAAGTSDAPFSVTITGANTDNASRTVRVGTLVNGTTTGTCLVTFSRSGQPDVTATNEVTLQNNAYVCPVFAIPYDQFSVSGNWTVRVSVKNNDKQATGDWAAGPVTINK